MYIYDHYNNGLSAVRGKVHVVPLKVTEGLINAYNTV